jgi:hypothetical protein
VVDIQYWKKPRFVPQSNELSYYSRGTTELVHIGARALLDINLIWFGYIDRLGCCTHSIDFYLPSLSIEEGGGVSILCFTLAVVLLGSCLFPTPSPAQLSLHGTVLTSFLYFPHSLCVKGTACQCKLTGEGEEK